MRLTVRIPKSEGETLPAALSLARSAPLFETESRQQAPAYVATFPDLSLSLDLVERLISEVMEIPGTQAFIDARPVANLTKFWSALLCYRESLADDPRAYCAQQAARVGDAAGCPNQSCASHCRFICTRCFQVAREKGMPPVAEQLRTIAVQAEVEWCPNLHLPNGPSDVKRQA